MGWGKRLHIVQLKLCTLFMLSVFPVCPHVPTRWQQSHNGFDTATKSWNFHLLLSKDLLKVMQVPTFVLLQMHWSVMDILPEEFITLVIPIMLNSKWHPFSSITYTYLANGHMVSGLYYSDYCGANNAAWQRLYRTDGAIHCGGLYLHHIPLQSPLILHSALLYFPEAARIHFVMGLNPLYLRCLRRQEWILLTSLFPPVRGNLVSEVLLWPHKTHFLLHHPSYRGKISYSTGSLSAIMSWEVLN